MGDFSVPTECGWGIPKICLGFALNSTIGGYMKFALKPNWPDIRSGSRMASIKDVNELFSRKHWMAKAKRHDEILAIGIHEHNTGWAEYILSRRIPSNDFTHTI